MKREKGVKTIQIDLVCPESGDLLPGDVRVVFLQWQAQADLCDGEAGLPRGDQPRRGQPLRITQVKERG